LPLDLLLLTKGEVISNFENHNPLFLDIAAEGVVIFDEDSFEGFGYWEEAGGGCLFIMTKKGHIATLSINTLDKNCFF
jgi:hypothetical protein